MEYKCDEDSETRTSLKTTSKINSNDSEERKAARSIRIVKRQENIKRQELITEESKFDLFENDESISIVEKQAAECAALLEHLLADGEEKVTNIRVANDAREVTRRFKEARKKQELLAKLEDDANLAQSKFDEITAQWSQILGLNDPLDIENEINLQKQRCDDLLLQKNNLISDLKKELQRADETFYKDLKKQLNDIKNLGERIDDQVILMKNAYQSQLSIIEQSIEMEQTITIKNNEERWNILYNQRDQDESQNTEKKIIQISDFKTKIDAMLTEHREKFRLTKIKHEYEIQALQNEFQELKANCLINTEKIDYNYQILKRREEENILIRSQQKRRLNKMQDTINDLKSKIKSISKNSACEEFKTNKEIQRFQNSLYELQSKANHFANINDKKYKQVWKMNQEKANDLIQSISNLDKCIHEDILEFEWNLPEINILKQTDLPSYKCAVLFTFDNLIVSENKKSISKDDQNYPPKYNDNLIKHILNMIADNSGFLIEERLWSLLEKYENEPSKLCKLDNIFNALNITDENSTNLLCRYFANYAYCADCKSNENLNQIMQTDDGYNLISVEKSRSQTDKAVLKCRCGKSLIIAPGDTLSAIQDYIANTKTNEEQIKSPTSLCSQRVSRGLTEKDVKLFWGKYNDIFTTPKQKLWDNIVIALNKYLPILQDRQKLHKEVTLLRKQNSELKNLLRGHNNAESYKQKYLAPLQKGFKI